MRYGSSQSTQYFFVKSDFNVFSSGSVFRSYNKQHKEGFYSNEGGELQNLSDFPKCVVVNDDFDWEGDKPLNYPLEKTVIYETHLKGFTASPSSGVKNPGTYKGFAEKAEYLGKIFREEIEKHEFVSDNITMKTTVSGGVFETNDKVFANHNEWLKNADSALYKAKETGRNKIIYF